MQNRKFRILIVDDEAERWIFKLLKVQIAKAGYELVLTLNGEDGLEAAKNAHEKNQRFDLVLMDRWMPMNKTSTVFEKGGEEITKKWRLWEKEEGIKPHFIVSHSSDKELGQIERTDAMIDKYHYQELQTLINKSFPQFAYTIPERKPSIEKAEVQTPIVQISDPLPTVAAPIVQAKQSSQVTFPFISRCGFFAIATVATAISAGIYYANNYLNPRQ